MSIQDEYTTVLRDELGEGYEAMAMAGLMKEYVKRSLKPKVLARRRQAVDNSALEIARAAKEKALLDETDARKVVEDGIVTQLNLDVGGL